MQIFCNVLLIFHLVKLCTKEAQSPGPMVFQSRSETTPEPEPSQALPRAGDHSFFLCFVHSHAPPKDEPRYTLPFPGLAMKECAHHQTAMPWCSDDGECVSVYVVMAGTTPFKGNGGAV